MAITLPDANDEKCLILYEKMKNELISYSDSINIKNIDQKFFKEIVIPIALYLNSTENVDDEQVVQNKRMRQRSSKKLFLISNI